MQLDLKKHTIALHFKGSQAYGLATEASDIDLGGVFIPPAPYVLGFMHRIEQVEHVQPLAYEFRGRIEPGKKVEGTIYALQKMLKLCADCNPNMIEILWIEEEDFLLKTRPFERIQEIRDCFLSRKARFTFSGYAVSQIKRMETHRKWLLDPPTEPPERSDFGLAELSKAQFDAAEALIRHEIEHWAYHDLNIEPEVAVAVKEKTREQVAHALAALGLPKIDPLDEEAARRAAMAKIGFDENLSSLIERESRYQNALRRHRQYLDWKKNRNAERAALEAKSGYDTKHGAHVVRLLRMGEEILADGRVIVKRRGDREELLSIRRGAWSYDRLMEYADAMQAKMETLYQTSKLRKTPDLETIDRLCIELMSEAHSA